MGNYRNRRFKQGGTVIQ